MQVNVESINREVDAGFVRRQTNPDGSLSIYTYSTKTEMEDHWNPITLMTRGLVVANEDSRVVAPCIPKFFNINQPHAAHIDLRSPGVIITEKNDGYLIQIVRDPEYGLVVTSKGSFVSPMAIKAKSMVSDYAEEFEEGRLYVCELCCNFPGDQGTIVTRWKDESLVCFAIRDMDGKELELQNLPKCLRKVQEFTPSAAEDYLQRNDVEGVVLRLGQERVKVKTQHFLQMHRMISNISKKRVWELLSSGQRVEELDLPDEFIQMMLDWQKEMLEQIDYWKANIDLYASIFQGFSNKDVATCPTLPQFYKSALLAQRAGKDLAPMLWRQLKNKIKEENKDG